MEFINKKNYKVIFTKGTGAGGQHKNKTETCATVIHIPTGMREMCQETRYKNKNKDIALERLNKRIEERIKLFKHRKLNQEKINTLKDAGVIRTYNFPRNEVKDHRTGKTADLKKVLNGKLDLL